MEGVIEKIIALLEQNLVDTDYFLVDIKIKPTNNVKIYLDGDTGINISASSKINKSLYNKIIEDQLFPEDDFSLEVSSPGLDAPLKLVRQYKKNMGRTLEITKNDDTEIIGKLILADDDKIEVEEEKIVKNGKKKEKVVEVHQLPYADIKSTYIQIKF